MRAEERSGASTLWQSFAGSIAKERNFLRRYRQMHAKHADKNGLNELSGNVIGCAFTVVNMLAARFLEKVYENALAHELRKAAFAVAQQRGATVMYDGTVVGEYFVDLMIVDALLVELKTVKALDEPHMPPGARPGGRAQCVNSLKATGRQLCLLLNFDRRRLEIKRLANRL